MLAAGVADVRTARVFDGLYDRGIVRRFGPELTERLGMAAEKRTKTRKTLFFGIETPHRDLVEALRCGSQNLFRMPSSLIPKGVLVLLSLAYFGSEG